MIYLGLDLGSKTLGLSISDRTGIIATPLEVIRYENYDELMNKLNEIVISRNVDVLVLGNPKNLNGTLSKRSEETISFKEMLEEKYGYEIVLQDERLSTVEANNILMSNNTRRNKRKKVIDKMASTIILQSYLDRRQ